MASPTGSFDSLGEFEAASGPAIIAPLAAATPFASETQPPSINFTPSGGPSASMAALYVTNDDNVQLTVWNSNALLTEVQFQVRVLKPDGSIVILTYKLPNPTSDRTRNTIAFQLTEGFLLGAVVGPPGAAMVRGQAFCNLAILRGAVSNPLWTDLLIADYITTAFLPAWPYGQLRNAADGQGNVTSNVGAAPGAGADPSITVPTRALWLLQSVKTHLLTDGVAGNRQVGLQILGGGGANIFTGNAAAAQAASLGYDYSFAPGLALDAHTPIEQTAPLPAGLLLQPGSLISFVCLGIDAGDQFAAVSVQVVEWLDV
jgi:hypothetical protein